MTVTVPAPAVQVPGRREASWGRPALVVLLVLTAALYLWGLSASGWANSFYSAAVQAGTKSWKAFFFGSSDAANFITVDKPPASLWVMELSTRIFGVNSWAILAPQALEGVATVAVVHAAVRRRAGEAAALVAGAALALTPVATLMFRFNNPDALLALLLTAAAYAVLRAQERAQTRWLVLAGAALGFAFLAKTLQAFLVLPAFGLTYLFLAPTGWWRRIRQLLLALAVMVVSGGWWVAAVELTPAQDRPYVGGSQHNSFLELTFGYNGFGRLDGSETGSVGGGGGRLGGGGGGMWGQTGLTRLFTGEMGGQIAWLLPTAALLLLAGLWLTRRAPRTDPYRAALLLWGLALIATFLTFSLMKGIFHPYYNIALAPYAAALIGLGGGLLRRERHSWLNSGLLAAAVAVTAVTSFVLLRRSPDFVPWLRYAVLVVGLLTALALVAAGRLPRLLAGGLAVLGAVAGLAGPAAYSLQTASTGHSGSLPSAGPAVAGGGFGGPGGGGFPGGRGGFPGGGQGGFPGGGATGGGQAGATGEQPGQGVPGGNSATAPGAQNGQAGGGRTVGGLNGQGGFPGGAAEFGANGGLPGGTGRGGAGGHLNGSNPGSAITALLKADASKFTWVAAAVGSQNASGYQLATGDPVMALGGFNGSDPAPSLAQFQAYAAAGKIHYFIGGGGMGGGAGGPGAGGSTTSQISSWVAAHYTAKTVDGVTVYDLSGVASK
ncbi:ArnT family glycosyltransferase [Streptacidiphilus monticola]|uniref:ArnT family glycosyltransferase n=1 Tax=Streptacidiphilus monticola TaxID=2161674 RepID=A0ABW1FUH7_9ACTN